MAKNHRVSVNGDSFVARHGELLLDAALKNGVDLPFDCRSGHCGTCCVRVVWGEVLGGEGAEPNVVHACQCRVVGDGAFEQAQTLGVRSVAGELAVIRSLSRAVMEVTIRTDRALPYHAGQYAQLRFAGFATRPFSITHPVNGNTDGRSVCFHIRRMRGGAVTPALGKRIGPGHRVELTGPFGAAYFRPNQHGRLLLVATNTGFAPIWSIAVAALRENPKRRVMIIAGGRNSDALYMGPALGQLARFPNVVVVASCSTPQPQIGWAQFGRPTDFIPELLPTDVVYACGAPAMVESVKTIAAHFGTTCYSDPFMTASAPGIAENGAVLARAKNWFATTASQETGQPILKRA